MKENNQTQIIKILSEKGLTLSTAESCTGGLLVAHLIDVPGASNVIKESYVTYSIDAKNRILGVDLTLINQYGVASYEVSEAMASGLQKRSGANICIATTGEAGSSLTEKQTAFCYYTIIVNNQSYSFITEVETTRNVARNAFCEAIYEKLLEILKRED